MFLRILRIVDLLQGELLLYYLTNTNLEFLRVYKINLRRKNTVVF